MSSGEKPTHTLHASHAHANITLTEYDLNITQMLSPAHSTLAVKSLEIHSVHKLYVAYHTLSSPLRYHGNVLYSSLAYRRCMFWSFLLADPAM